MTTEQLQPANWTDLLLKPGPKWERKIAKAPVVKLTHPGGKVEFAVTSPVIFSPYDGVTPLTSFHYEISESGLHKTDSRVLLSTLESGKILRGSTYSIKVEFAGFAQDPEHKHRKWSHIDPN